ncbi:MAG TPA: tRNA (cytidine(34)-2'-O)-methyltransferase [Burkholderiales bacterium]|nr:tRNA (cytidine(34)-2'-O)-methyltransferase [Burkholderiales bacterium]
MLDIVLVHPEIPPNAGNVIRLAANSGARLHLVEPLGFSMDDRQLKRAGLDYHELASVKVHRSWKTLEEHLGERRMFAFTTKGAKNAFDVRFAMDDVLVFGGETTGLPEAILSEFPAEHRLRLPMRPGNRSLNLSNAVAVAVYEAWRQLGFGA